MKNSETKRLEIVNHYETLNLNSNKELNDLVTLAIEISDAPIAFISLMGADTQWIKWRSGIDIEENSRENSFCKYLINTTKVMVVPDTLNDERFVNNPAVTGEMAVRFYAGAPLINASGYHIGSICVIDKKPRLFSYKQKKLLAILARQVSSIMELQLSIQIIEQHNSEMNTEKEKTVNSEHKLRAFFNSSATCHTLIDKGMNILDFNNATAVHIKKLYHKKIEAGKNILQYVNTSYKSDFIKYIKSAFAGRSTHKEILLDFGKKSDWWNISFEPIKDEKGNIISVANSATDINDQKQQLMEIKDQNRLLLRIAYIQSHEYRKPVATILGLMNIIKDNNYKSSKKCLILMEKTVNELDDTIKNIVNSIEYKFSDYAMLPL
ncbi:GAF domain-containing protein [Mucilaginibacter sp.]|uniref:GAF domain-containing protein n=1 Tax=Mucilaginibacter sp. TaxID=1882438 RepID=UPI003D099D6B